MLFTTSVYVKLALLVSASIASALPSPPHRPAAASNVRKRDDASAPVAASWYANWHATDVPLANLSWSKYTHMIYSFGTTSATEYVSLTDQDQTLLPDFVKNAHANNVKALLSIGGWGGGTNYSTIVGDATHRSGFVKTIADLVKQYSLDGIDFDWEFPNGEGIGCNAHSADDTANFLSFLQELRADPTGSNLFLTAAAGIRPWNDAKGDPSKNVTGFSTVLDYVAIMNYDIYGSFSSTAGPNAPLNDSCVADKSQAAGSAVSAVNAWHTAGIPLNQLVLGVPAYGHSYSVKPAAALPKGSSGELVAFPAFDNKSQPMGDSWDSAAPFTDVCGNTQGASGVFDYWGLVKGGWLSENGTAAEGISHLFDECSQTPFVYNSSSGVFVSYDDAQSLAAKGSFIKTMGLRGFSMWETGGDYKDTLLDSVRSAVGFSDSNKTTTSSGDARLTTAAAHSSTMKTGKSATATATIPATY
ncbi:glycoside hydrolase family 18 protein [Auriscalpium vulgare]|uniref:Glycoside hydrolase family 18 protein n=1 Tax=Auriscalpium vulgare TaxID=40419 RepID=A0ACB8RWE8_9AGAM|nr:glycoside hydrolase family 18 protein [Auriscalpium vulgare]